MRRQVVSDDSAKAQGSAVELMYKINDEETLNDNSNSSSNVLNIKTESPDDNMYYDTTNIANKFNAEESVQSKADKRNKYSCLICNDVAKINSLGLAICDACAWFFRRIIRTKRQLKCKLNENCIIVKKKRDNCTYCRFKKCLSVGMTSKAGARIQTLLGKNETVEQQTFVVYECASDDVEFHEQNLAEESWCSAEHADNALVDIKPDVVMLDIQISGSEYIEPDIALQCTQQPHIDSMMEQDVVTDDAFVKEERAAYFAQALPATIIENFDCLICEAETNRNYYGIRCCHACGIFFKETIVNERTYVCQNNDGRCEINVKTRKYCQHCRLKKCFSQGMQSQKIKATRRAVPVAAQKQIVCLICGDRTSSKYHNIQSCISCRLFFKRSVLNRCIFECETGEGECLIEPGSNCCAYCRFQKCLNNGMQREWVQPNKQCKANELEAVNELKLGKQSVGKYVCLVCGDRTSRKFQGFHSCGACRFFFRRSVLNQRSYACQNMNGKCLIDLQTRNDCKQCRFEKCLRVGMEAEPVLRATNQKFVVKSCTSTLAEEQKDFQQSNDISNNK